MHGPASVGATMSASEVTVQFGIVSSICSAIPGSKIVTSSGTSSSRWRTSSAIRSGNASSRVATQTMSGRPPSSASRSDPSSASLEPRDLPAARVQRLADLLREVATTHQEHAPRDRPRRGPYFASLSRTSSPTRCRRAVTSV